MIKWNYMLVWLYCFAIKEAKRQMRMNKNSFKIIETNEKYGIEVTVNYYVLPNKMMILESIP